MADDERRSIRYPLGMACVYRLQGIVMEPVSGIIRDVSRHGCCLETTDEVGGLDEMIEIHFNTPPGAPEGLIAGLVVQRQKTPLGGTLGVAFRAADPAVKWELLDAAYRGWQDRLAAAAR